MDWDDLNDWIYDNYPEVWEATRYLQLPAQLKCWRTIYEKHLQGVDGRT